MHGRVVANDKSEAARYLRVHDIYPIKIEEEGKNQLSFFTPKGSIRPMRNVGTKVGSDFQELHFIV